VSAGGQAGTCEWELPCPPQSPAGSGSGVSWGLGAWLYLLGPSGQSPWPFTGAVVWVGRVQRWAREGAPGQRDGRGPSVPSRGAGLACVTPPRPAVPSLPCAERLCRLPDREERCRSPRQPGGLGGEPRLQKRLPPAHGLPGHGGAPGLRRQGPETLRAHKTASIAVCSAGGPAPGTSKMVVSCPGGAGVSWVYCLRGLPPQQ